MSRNNTVRVTEIRADAYYGFDYEQSSSLEVKFAGTREALEQSIAQLRWIADHLERINTGFPRATGASK